MTIHRQFCASSDKAFSSSFLVTVVNTSRYSYPQSIPAAGRVCLWLHMAAGLRGGTDPHYDTAHTACTNKVSFLHVRHQDTGGRVGPPLSTTRQWLKT